MIHGEIVKEVLGDETCLTTQIAGNCMAPVLNHGSLVRSEKRAVYWPGDILTFTKTNGCLVTHRCLGYIRYKGAWRLLTKADDAEEIDGLVRTDRILGRVSSVSGQALTIAHRDRFFALSNYFRALFRALRRRAHVPEVS